MNIYYKCGTHCKGTLIYTHSSGPKTLLSVRQQRQRTPVDKNVSWSQWCVWGTMHPVGPHFSPFEGGPGSWIFAVPNFVPMKFSLCFHKICKFSICSPSFQWVPQLVPTALALCHILCPQYCSCNLYEGAQRMRLRLQHIISVSGMFKSWFKKIVPS